MHLSGYYGKNSRYQIFQWCKFSWEIAQFSINHRESTELESSAIFEKPDWQRSAFSARAHCGAASFSKVREASRLAGEAKYARSLAYRPRPRDDELNRWARDALILHKIERSGFSQNFQRNVFRAYFWNPNFPPNPVLPFLPAYDSLFFHLSSVAVFRWRSWVLLLKNFDISVIFSPLRRLGNNFCSV